MDKFKIAVFFLFKGLNPLFGSLLYKGICPPSKLLIATPSEELVQTWRRSYELGPPGGETLKETGDRVLPYYLNEIHPMLMQDMNILVAAHGNSLRSLIKYLDKVSDEDIVKLEIPTGAPIHYRFNEDGKVMYKKSLIE